MANRAPDDEGSSLYSGLTSPTVKISGPTEERLTQTVSYSFGEPKTQMYRGPAEPENAAEMPAEDPMQDPCVGWLVVTAGKGRGASLKLGYGRNSIGRDSGEKVSLNFGDDQISRVGHALLTYDPRSRKFFLQSGTGANLAYIENRDEPVLAPVILQRGDVILLGRTKLTFQPFCGPDFDWQDVSLTP